MFEEVRLEGDFTLSSGKKSTFFYDFDLLSPEETAQYCKRLVGLIPRETQRTINFVAAPALGGIVPGFLVAFALNKPLVIVDKEDKVRGPSFLDSNYLVVDDVITTFQAVDKVRKALGSNTCTAVAAYIFRGALLDVSTRPHPVYYLARGEQEE